ncbi:hypothetical protein NAP1_03690 [Erythrobacter sp. NAP1]|nr:hypothetical protein NAP1_03690 [Erythrobacter sp. NAP1]
MLVKGKEQPFMASWEKRRKRRDAWGWERKNSGRKARRSASFSDEYIENLIPEDRDYPVYDLAMDSDVDRLLLIVRPSGSKTFYYRRLGEGDKRKVRIGIFGKLLTHEARARVREISRLLDRGGSLSQFINSRSGQTVQDAFRIYIGNQDFTEEWEARTLATFEKHLLPRIGKLRLPAIKFEDLERALAGCKTDHQKRQQREMLSAFLSWCVKTGRIPSNPLKGRPAPPRPRRLRQPVDLGEQELHWIWDASANLPGKWCEAIRLTIAQAKPISEVLQTRGYLTQAQKERELSETTCFAHAYLLQVAGGREGYVFSARGKSEPLQFQSRISQILNSQMPMPLNFSMSDIVRGSIESLAILRESKTQWDEIHPAAVRYINPPQPEIEEVEL